jgi:hypothetical protein
MRRAPCSLLLLFAALVFAGCADSDAKQNNASPNGAIRGCLERPDQLPRAPQGSLPGELIPPGLTLVE